MSLGILTPCSLQGIGTRLGWRLREEHRLHISQNYKDAQKMVARMEKPRVMITFLPVCVEGSTQAFESIVEHMGPLDVVLDCILESDENTNSRSSYCQEKSTQYMSIRIEHGGVFVRGPRVAYLENKNLLRKINRCIYYVCEIEEV
jgi:6-phosphogluconate dehydrogenase